MGHGALYGSQAHLQAEFPLEVLSHHVTVAAVLEEALLQPLGMLVQAGTSDWRPIRLPAS
jgi:hypothetical protein